MDIYSDDISMDFFRADSLSEAMDYLQQIIRVHGGLSLTVKPSLLLFITLLIIGDWLGRKTILHSAF